jgi:putative chitinase
MIDYSKLTKHLPEHVYVQILDVVIKYKINTPLRLAHFLAQCHHESAGFNVVEENLNYSAEGLLRTFKKYFTPEQANEYAHNKVKIASRVYANRMGNGDEASQEGWLYRGRGYIQLTGKDNYAAFNDQFLKIS